MSFQSINDEISQIAIKLEALNIEITNLGICINATENPDESVLFAELFDKKVLEFNKLQSQFTAVLLKFDQEKKKDNIVSFTARKLLKVTQ
jgi:hypothetical protein